MNIELLFNFLICCWAINLSLNIFKFIPGVKQKDKPLDQDMMFVDNKRLLGTSTTIIGIPVALFTGLLLGVCFYDWKIGLLIGLCVYGGHALGSFIKRRFGYDNGKFMPIIDHGDYILLTGLIMVLIHQISWNVFLWGFVITLLVQPIFCYIGYKMKLREQPL